MSSVERPQPVQYSLRDLFAIFALTILLLCVRFFPFLNGKTMIFGDNYSLMVPGKIFTAQWLRKGELPKWNPYLFAGTPWVEDINQSVLYPTTLLFAKLHPATALNWSIVIHELIAFIGMWQLARRWVRGKWWPVLAGWLWMLSTQVTGSINNLSTIQSIVWLPWLMWWGEQVTERVRAKYIFAVLVLVQFLAGYPQHVIFGIVTAVVFSAVSYALHWQPSHWRAWGSWWQQWLMTAGLAIGLAGVAWVPFMEALLQSTRMDQSLDQAAVGSLHPAMLIKLVLPYFFDSPRAGIKWGPAWSGQPNVVMYVTWLGLMAVAWNARRSLFDPNRQERWRERLLWLIAIVTGGLSLGSYVPGFTVFQQLVPIFKIGRYPSMLLIVTNVVVILMAVRALARWQLSKRVYWTLFISLAIVTVVGLLLWNTTGPQFTTVWQQFDHLVKGKLSASAFHTVVRDELIVKMISFNLTFAALLTLVALVLYRFGRTTLLALVLAVEMVLFTHGHFFFAPASVYPSWSEIDNLHGKFMGRPIDPQTRWLTRNGNVPYTDFGSYWEALVVRAPFSDSFVDDEQLTRYKHPMALQSGLTPIWNTVYGVRLVHGYTALLPRDYAALWQNPSDPHTRINFIPYVPLDHPELSRWAVNQYLVDEWFTIKEDLNSLQPVASTSAFGHPLTQYQLPGLARFRFADGSAVQLTDFHESPNRVSFSFDNPTNQSKLLMADRYDADWVVWVNNFIVKLADDRGVRVIPIQPGRNTIEMKYQATSLYAGTGLTWLTAVVALALYAKRR